MACSLAPVFGRRREKARETTRCGCGTLLFRARVWGTGYCQTGCADMLPFQGREKMLRDVKSGSVRGGSSQSREKS